MWMSTSMRALAAVALLTPTATQPGEPSTAFPFEQFMPNPFGRPKPEEDAELAKVPISLAEEKRLGDADAKAYLDGFRRQKVKVADRGRDVEYLRELVETLRHHMTNKDRYPSIKIYVVDSPSTDARSFPGGTLVIFRGLLEFVDSEAALVGVLGHELSHLDRGHQLLALRRMKHVQRSFDPERGAASPERMMSSLSTLVGGFARPFRPEDESQADHDGADWAFRAGYDPREFAKVLLKLHERDGKGAIPISFLRTHPFHIDRCQAIEAQAAELQRQFPAQATYVGKQNLAKRTARSRREFPE